MEQVLRINELASFHEKQRTKPQMNRFISVEVYFGEYQVLKSI